MPQVQAIRTFAVNANNLEQSEVFYTKVLAVHSCLFYSDRSAFLGQRFFVFHSSQSARLYVSRI
jgi:hypothetical protein